MSDAPHSARRSPDPHVLWGRESYAASPIQATLTLPNDTVLPGVPFDIVVTYTNVSDRVVTIQGATATLVVTFPNGESKVFSEPDASDHWNISGVLVARLAPGDSVQHAASWEDGSIPIRTPAVTLTRVDPVGIDAELWKRMQTVSGGAWADNNFAATKAGYALATEIQKQRR